MKKLLLGFIICLMFLTGCGNSMEAREGDVVKIDFIGKIDGVAFDGGTASNQIVEIGAGNYIPGFEEGIVGMKSGETKTIQVTFPESYYETLAGKDATFDITVKTIYREVK